MSKIPTPLKTVLEGVVYKEPSTLLKYVVHVKVKFKERDIITFFIPLKESFFVVGN